MFQEGRIALYFKRHLEREIAQIEKQLTQDPKNGKLQQKRQELGDTMNVFEQAHPSLALDFFKMMAPHDISASPSSNIIITSPPSR